MAKCVLQFRLENLQTAIPAKELTQMNIKNEWDATGTAHKYDPDGADMLLMKPISSVRYYRFGQVRNL